MPEGYVPSKFTPHLSESAVGALEKKGFLVTRASTSVVLRGSASSVCLMITVQRRITVIWLRLFGPLVFLMIIPFAGFWLPVTAVMPRIATGFISFLALQVFRSMMYGMVPRKSHSLLWVDVTMFCVTEIMFLAVLQNVIAQAIYAKKSAYASTHVDRI